MMVATRSGVIGIIAAAAVIFCSVITVQLHAVDALWPPKCGHFSLEDWSAADGTYTPVSGLDYNPLIEEFVTVCWIASGSPTGTQSQYSKSTGTIFTVYTKMAVIIVLNQETKEFLFRMHPKIATYANSGGATQSQFTAAGGAVEPVNSVPLGYAVGCGQNGRITSFDLRNTGYVLAATAVPASLGCGSSPSWAKHNSNGGQTRDWMAIGNCGFLTWLPGCSESYANWNGLYRIQLWRSIDFNPEAGLEATSSEYQATNGWRTTTHYQVNLQQFSQWDSSSWFTGSAFVINPSRWIEGGTMNAQSTPAPTGPWVTLINANSGIIPVATALANSVNVDDEAPTRMDLRAWTLTGHAWGLTGIHSGQFITGALSFTPCGAHPLKPTGTITPADPAVWDVRVAGDAALTPTLCTRTEAQIASGVGFVIALIRVGCPANHVLVGTQCRVTCPPGTTRGPDPDVCVACPMDTYAPTINSECLPCSTGARTSGTGSTICNRCISGRYLVPATGTCPICEVGKANNVPAATSCAPCAVGTFANSAGAASCTLCAAGSYASGTGATVCAACGIGKATALTGQAACVDCVAGSFADVTGLATCTLCEPGTAIATAGAFQCDPCVGGRYQSGTGGTTCMACATNPPTMIGSNMCCLTGLKPSALDIAFNIGTSMWALRNLACTLKAVETPSANPCLSLGATWDTLAAITAGTNALKNTVHQLQSINEWCKP